MGSTGTDTTIDESPARTPVGWWVALGVAVAFLAGSAGYLIGGQAADPQRSYSDLDRGFLVDMISHHDQAVEMAAISRPRAEDPIVSHMIEEVIAFQRWEIGVMDEMLAQAGGSRPETDPERITMEWMNMPTPLRFMPGMASAEQLEALALAEGYELDVEFLLLMRAHHIGGLHMADYAAEHAENARVRELAARMAHNQRIEVNEYNARLERLGVDID